MRGARLFAALVAVLSTGCASVTPPAGTLAWPAEGPRVRLERILEKRSDAGSRSFLSFLGGGDEPLFVRPYGVAWDGDDLLVTDPGAHRVVRLKGHGGIATSPAGTLDDPLGIAACAEGPIVSEPSRGRVVLLDRDLHIAHVVRDGLTRPSGLACQGKELFIAETGGHRVLILEGGGERQLGRRGAGNGEFNFPAALALDGSTLWVGDTLNFRVQRFDTATQAFRARFGTLGDAVGELPRLKGLAVDASGHLWVSDAHLDAVTLFTPDGTFLVSIGGPGSRSGEFAFPTGIAAHADGRIAVVDALNRRVQLFRLVPEGVPR